MSSTKKPKLAKAWAVVDCYGTIFYSVIGGTQSQAWQYAEEVHGDIRKELKKQGYRCFRVLIAPL